MNTMTFQITSLTIVYSTVYSGADRRKHQSSASLIFVRGIHRSPVNSPHKVLVTRKMFPFDDVIMITRDQRLLRYGHITKLRWCPCCPVLIYTRTTSVYKMAAIVPTLYEVINGKGTCSSLSQRNKSCSCRFLPHHNWRLTNHHSFFISHPQAIHHSGISVSSDVLFSFDNMAHS